MNKSSLLLMTLALTTWSWIRQPEGNLVDRVRSSLRVSEDDALRALAWLRTELHNLSLASSGGDDAVLPMLANEVAVRQALCATLDAQPVVALWVDDAVLDGTPRHVAFPLSSALDELAGRLSASPAPAGGVRPTPGRPSRPERRLRLALRQLQQPDTARSNPPQPAPAGRGRAQPPALGSWVAAVTSSDRPSTIAVRPTRHVDSFTGARRGR